MVTSAEQLIDQYLLEEDATSKLSATAKKADAKARVKKSTLDDDQYFASFSSRKNAEKFIASLEKMKGIKKWQAPSQQSGSSWRVVVTV